MENGIVSSIFIVVSITSVIMGFLLLIYGAAVLVISIRKEVKRSRTRNEDEYELMYGVINARLGSYEVNSNNYQRLKSQIEILGTLRHKNHEKTTVLVNEFLKRFGKQYNQELIDQIQRA